jgi:MATE family multidrug resistance protein
LWATLLSYMTSNMLLLGVSLPETFKDKSLENQPSSSS